MKNIDWKLSVLIGILIAGVIFGVVYFYQQMSGGATVTVTGNSETKVAPDQAVISLLIQTKDVSADAAKNENSKISDDVTTALIKAGIEMKNIETENYNIYPEYNWTNGGQDITGYTVSNSMKITTDDFKNVGKIIDASVDNGATISYINFELSNAKSNEYKASILANATADANNKASAIAAGLGKRVGKIVSITIADYNYYPYPLYNVASSTGSVKSVATNIQPQNLDISASVTVVYKIV
jgi:uncharacterized protein YggE